MHAMTAGHPTLPMPSYAWVTNLQNGRTVLVRVNDRGPYAKDRLIDLSYQTAHTLGFSQRGLARVRVRYAGRAPLSGDDSAERRHLAAQSWYGGRRAAQSETASITTGSVSTKRVRTVDYGSRPRRRRLGPSIDIAAASSRAPSRPNPCSPSLPSIPTCASGRSRRRPRWSACATCWAEATPAIIEASGSRNDPAYRLRLGPYDDSDAAAAMARIIAAGFEPDASQERLPGAAGSKR